MLIIIYNCLKTNCSLIDNLIQHNNKLYCKFDKKFEWELVMERTKINLHKKEKPIKRKQVISKLMLVVPKIFQKFTV